MLTLIFKIYLAQGENHTFKTAPKCYSKKLADIYYSETKNQKLFEWVNLQAKKL